jgi:hypothetical protein
MENNNLERFYVYDVLNADGVTIYVGKGSGRRAYVSCRERGGHEFKIVERFASECAAYAKEVARIAEIKPLLNIAAGGNGSRAIKRRIFKDKWQRTLEAIGSRKYAARLLLACIAASSKAGVQYPGDLSKVDAIREIAYG